MTEEVWRSPIKAFGCREIRQLVRLHLFDIAVHGHDLTDALGVPAIWAPALSFLTEFVVRAAPPTLVRRGLEPSGSLLVSVDGKRWLIDSSDGSWRVVHDAAAEEGGASIEADAETLVLLATGRGDRKELLRSAVISRDSQTGQRMLEAWRVV
jgi:hypothetical protein